MGTGFKKEIKLPKLHENVIITIAGSRGGSSKGCNEKSTTHDCIVEGIYEHHILFREKGTGYKIDAAKSELHIEKIIWRYPKQIKTT